MCAAHVLQPINGYKHHLLSSLNDPLTFIFKINFQLQLMIPSVLELIVWRHFRERARERQNEYECIGCATSSRKTKRNDTHSNVMWSWWIVAMHTCHTMFSTTSTTNYHKYYNSIVIIDIICKQLWFTINCDPSTPWIHAPIGK